MLGTPRSMDSYDWGLEGMCTDGLGARKHHIRVERIAARRFVAPKAARGFVYYAPESLTILHARGKC